MKNLIKCPVCGNDVEVFDICDVCGYQNNGRKEALGDSLGANKMSLEEAIYNYNKYGNIYGEIEKAKA